MMQTYTTVRFPNRMRKVFDGESNLIAAIEPTVLGEFAYGAFVAALAPYPRVRMFDQDSQEYVVGDLADLIVTDQ